MMNEALSNSIKYRQENSISGMDREDASGGITPVEVISSDSIVGTIKHEDHATCDLETRIRKRMVVATGNESIKKTKSAEVDLPLSLRDGASETSRLPLNFIWFGSVIPDVYLINIRAWAMEYPDRLTLLWINSVCMSDVDNVIMARSKSFFPDNVRLLDVSDNKLLSQTSLNTINQWIFKDLDIMSNSEKTRAFCLASDIYRMAILYYGGELLKNTLDSADPLNKQYSGAIYFDTDIYLERMVSVQDTCFSGILFSHHQHEKIDVFAVSENKHPFFQEYFETILNNIKHETKPCIDIIRGKDLEMLSLSGYALFDSITDKYFSKKLVFFPFSIKSQGSDQSWIDGAAFGMSRDALYA